MKAMLTASVRNSCDTLSLALALILTDIPEPALQGRIHLQNIVRAVKNEASPFAAVVIEINTVLVYLLYLSLYPL